MADLDLARLAEGCRFLADAWGAGHRPPGVPATLRDAATALISAAERAEKLREALQGAERFISNGIELGYIRMPEMKGDEAHETLPAIRHALEATDE